MRATTITLRHITFGTPPTKTWIRYDMIIILNQVWRRHISAERNKASYMDGIRYRLFGRIWEVGSWINEECPGTLQVMANCIAEEKCWRTIRSIKWRCCPLEEIVLYFSSYVFRATYMPSFIRNTHAWCWSTTFYISMNKVHTVQTSNVRIIFPVLHSPHVARLPSRIKRHPNMVYALYSVTHIRLHLRYEYRNYALHQLASLPLTLYGFTFG